MRLLLCLLVPFVFPSTVNAQIPDIAAMFGARESISAVSLSPDGQRIAFIMPGEGPSSFLRTVDLRTNKPTLALRATGKPEKLMGCGWVSDIRLVCTVSAVVFDGIGLNNMSRVYAVNADGTNLKMLSTRQTSNAYYTPMNGGDVLDYLPSGSNKILMARTYAPESSIGSNISSTEEGLGVDEVDSETGRAKRVIRPADNAVTYLSDGNGQVRIVGNADQRAGYFTGIVRYRFRLPGSNDWQPLSTYDVRTETGFLPSVVDVADNSVLGFEKREGRRAVYRIKLDGSGSKDLVFSHDAVDADAVVTIGRDRRPVGVTYAENRRAVRYFDPVISKLQHQLEKALPGQGLWIVDASADTKKLVIWASSDTNPGEYYLLDRTTRRLESLLPSRPELANLPLAQVKSVTTIARDGTPVPAYLTLPVGSDGKNLPAIIMPHGGPSARDEWGFDWLPQFFASRGYAVLQPNYRGSAGYGDEWYKNNGFKSWEMAIGDIADSGRWLINQGIANPQKLVIFGWSYGGYAALQAGAVYPDLFKAIIAIAPVTDLGLFRRSGSGYVNDRLIRDFVGEGTHIREGSPSLRAGEIIAPVMIVHGERDVNVDVEHARLMVRRLKDANRPADYTEIPGLDHYLEDSAVRRDLLAKSDAFFAKALAR